MDTHTALRQRRTIHAYTTDPVPPEVLLRALDAARFAPNHVLSFPWRFTQVGPRGRATIADLYVRLKDEAAGGLSDTKRRRYHAKVSDPAELLVVSQVRSDDPFREREDYASVAMAIQNLMLSIAADGYGSKWSTGGVTRHAETYAVCGIDPEAQAIVGFVWAGVACREARTPERPPLDTLLTTTE